MAEKNGSSEKRRPVCSGVVYFCAIGCITNPNAMQINAGPGTARLTTSGLSAYLFTRPAEFCKNCNGFAVVSKVAAAENTF